MHYNAMRPNLSNPNLKKGQNPKCAGLEELKFSIKVEFNPTCENVKKKTYYIKLGKTKPHHLPE